MPSRHKNNSQENDCGHRSLSDLLSMLSPNATGQLHVFGLNCDTFRVNGTVVTVLEQSDKMGFGGLL